MRREPGGREDQERSEQQEGEQEGEARRSGKAEAVQADEMPQEASLFAKGEFALSGVSGGEADGDFGGVAAAALDVEFEGDLVAEGVELFGAGEGFAAEGEEAAHGVGQGGNGSGE